MSYRVIPPTDGPEESAPPTLRRRAARALSGLLTFVGLKRPRRDEMGRWGRVRGTRLSALAGTVLVVWLLATMVHVVQAGNVGVPVTLGRAGDPVGQGIHISLPFTTMKQMTIRTTAYTMAAETGEGARADDDSVTVLGSDGASGSVDSTVLYRLDPTGPPRSTKNSAPNYADDLIRPSARTCIRSVFTDHTMVEAVTTAWHDMEAGVTTCLKEKVEPHGIVIVDFQLREVRLDIALQARGHRQGGGPAGRGAPAVRAVQGPAASRDHPGRSPGHRRRPADPRLRRGPPNGRPSPTARWSPTVVPNSVEELLPGPTHPGATCSSPTSRPSRRW